MNSESLLIGLMLGCPGAVGLAAAGVAFFAFHKSSRPDTQSKNAFLVLGILSSLFAVGIAGCYAVMLLA